MTRLKTEWVDYMIDGMADYNRLLQQKTGLDLCDLAASVFHADKDMLLRAGKGKKAAVVPVTQGQGVIGSFSEAVAAIIRSMGIEAVVTEGSDVEGMYEGWQKGCSLFFMADDDRYIGLNAVDGKIADNNRATAAGFIRSLEALASMAGEDLRHGTVLQIGYGIVGREAAEILSQKGIDFVLYDKDRQKLSGVPYKVAADRKEIRNYHYILDFTNEGGWLGREDLAEDVLYASPGVPYSMDEETAAAFEPRSIHDNLEIGTAVMLAQCLL